MEMTSLAVVSQDVYAVWSVDVCLGMTGLKVSLSPHVESCSQMYIYIYLPMWVTASLFSSLVTFELLRDLVPFTNKTSES